MSLDAMRKRFHELSDEKDRIEAASEPYRIRRDALQRQIAAIDQQIAPLSAKIKEIEKPLFDLDNERGALVRALKGKTGERAPRAVATVAPDGDAVAAELAASKAEMAAILQTLNGLSARVDALGATGNTKELAAEVAQMKQSLGEFARQLTAE